ATLLPPESWPLQRRVRLLPRTVLLTADRLAVGDVVSTVQAVCVSVLLCPEGSVARAVSVCRPAVSLVIGSVAPQACQAPASRRHMRVRPPTASSASVAVIVAVADGPLTAGTARATCGATDEGTSHCNPAPALLTRRLETRALPVAGTASVTTPPAPAEQPPPPIPIARTAPVGSKRGSPSVHPVGVHKVVGLPAEGPVRI